MSHRARHAGRWLRVGLFTSVIGFSALGSVGFKEPPSSAASENSAPRHRRPASCSAGDSLAPFEDSCPLLEQAHNVLARLNPSAVNYVEGVSCELNLEGNVEIQQALLREDLIWQQKGFGPRQLDALVFVSVALALQDAEALLKDLDQRLKEKSDPSLEGRRQRVRLFHVQAIALLQSLSTGLAELSDRELNFRF